MRTWILLALAISQGAWALAPCERQSQVGSWCEANIAALHPTQGGVGQIQVDNTQAELAGKSAKQLDKVMKKKEIPIVIAPDGGYWLVDRHHLTKALWQLGVKQVRVKVIARLQDKASFWSQRPGCCRMQAISTSRSRSTLSSSPGPAGLAGRWTGCRSTAPTWRIASIRPSGWRAATRRPICPATPASSAGSISPIAATERQDESGGPWPPLHHDRVSPQRAAACSSRATSPCWISGSSACTCSSGHSHQASACKRAISSSAKRILITLAGVPATMA